MGDVSLPTAADYAWAQAKDAADMASMGRAANLEMALRLNAVEQLLGDRIRLLEQRVAELEQRV